MTRDILERFIFPRLDSHSKSEIEKNLEPQKMDDNIYNKLSAGLEGTDGLNTEYEAKVLYHMNSKIIDFELDFADKRPQYALFLHDLQEECESR